MSIIINGKSYNSAANQRGLIQPDYTTAKNSGKSVNPNEIGTYYIANNPDLFEPQRTNNFKFEIHGLNGLVRAGVSEQDLAKDTDKIYTVFNQAEDWISMAVKSSTVPTYTQQAIEIKRGNGIVKFAGAPTFNKASIKLHDYIGAQIKDILVAWQNLSYNITTQKVGLANDYKKEAFLIEYTPDGQEIRRWKIYGCWISSLSFDEFNQDNNAALSASVELEYDHAELMIPEIENWRGK